LPRTAKANKLCGHPLIREGFFPTMPQVLLIVSLLISSAIILSPQRRQQIEAEVRPFDIQIDKLPAHFSGHDIKAIYTELAARRSKAIKGEFETTQEFEARIKREAAAPIFGRLDKRAYLAFVIQNSSGETIYDADRETMTTAVVLASGAENIYKPSDKKALTSKAEVAGEKYEGSNAFGAKTIVSRHTGIDYNVAFTNHQSFGISRYIKSDTLKRGHTEDYFASDAILIKIPIGLDLAREIKPRLKVLAIVKLIEPYTYDGNFYDKPTMDNPSEYIIQYHFLNTELIELWIYDDATGQVLIKKKPRI
jgi:hypothetical protein